MTISCECELRVASEVHEGLASFPDSGPSPFQTVTDSQLATRDSQLSTRGQQFGIRSLNSTGFANPAPGFGGPRSPSRCTPLFAM